MLEEKTLKSFLQETQNFSMCADISKNTKKIQKIK